MTPLDDPLLSALCVICRAVDFELLDDEARFLVPTDDFADGAVWAPVAFEVFDALIQRGWVELIGDDEFQVTQGGKYHYGRWEKQQEKAAKTTRTRGAISWRKARRS